MSERLNDYFAAEATEYLEQLARLLTLPGAPDADQLLRLATGVRGSAQMAGAETVGDVAERLEDAVRSIVSGNIAWSEEIRELSQQTVGDLRMLVRALNRWGPDEERRVQEAIVRWDEREEGEGAGEERVGGERTAADPETVPIEALFYDDAGPHVVDQTEVAPPRPVVDIGTLLFRGHRAIEKALALRPELERIARRGPPSDQAFEELVRELFDLLELGLSPEPPEA